MGLSIRAESARSFGCSLEAQHGLVDRVGQTWAVLQTWPLRSWGQPPYFARPRVACREVRTATLASFAEHFPMDQWKATSCVEKAFNASSKGDPIRRARQSTLWEDKTHLPPFQAAQKLLAWSWSWAISPRWGTRCINSDLVLCPYSFSPASAQRERTSACFAVQVC